jgi:hypothetical protein
MYRLNLAALHTLQDGLSGYAEDLRGFDHVMLQTADTTGREAKTVRCFSALPVENTGDRVVGIIGGESAQEIYGVFVRS